MMAPRPLTALALLSLLLAVDSNLFNVGTGTLTFNLPTLGALTSTQQAGLLTMLVLQCLQCVTCRPPC